MHKFVFASVGGVSPMHAVQLLLSFAMVLGVIKLLTVIHKFSTYR